MTKVLMMGGSGLVGRAVAAQMSGSGEFEIHATYRNSGDLPGFARWEQLDVGDPENLNRLLRAVKPQIIISCLRGNFADQLSLHDAAAEYLKRCVGTLYYFSTANVFDNDLSRPHAENDIPDSQTEYGQFKIACENKVRAILRENAVILRLPQVWGKASPRMRELKDSLKSGEKITVYPDLQINTNTDTMIAKQLCYIIKNRMTGIFHLAAAGSIGYREFYLRLAEGLGAESPAFEENFEEKGHFSLLPGRSGEFPAALRITNRAVLDYLTE